MKSETITVQQLFQDRRQYCVPFYQRAYVWTREDQWEQLWTDICDKAEAHVNGTTPTPHFLGAVVLDPQKRQGLMGVDIYNIIDGQQRITTLQFFLMAILQSLRWEEITSLQNFVQGFVLNPNPETMVNADIEVFKIWPTFKDRTNFKRAFMAADYDDMMAKFPNHFTQAGGLKKTSINHPLALEAIWYFGDVICKWLEKVDAADRPARAEALINAILTDFKIVTISLEADDDAQIIFETLNGRGAELHATDLIRNYLFMRADREKADSEQLYDTLWLSFETDYWSTKQRRGRNERPRLEWLIQASLQAEMCEDIDLARLYFEYRRFATSGKPPLTAQQQLERLTAYGDLYKELIGGVSHTPIGRFGARIAPYDITTLHPLALLVASSTADNTDKDEIFGDLVSYVVRRAICGLTPKNYNNVFMALTKQLRAAGVSAGKLRELLMEPRGDASRWPTDAEFRKALLTAPLYEGRLDAPKMRAVLTELEGALRAAAHSEEPTAPDLANLDIDHILPRTWWTYWSLPDGTMAVKEEVENAALILLELEEDTVTDRQRMLMTRANAIPTLGNLTLLNLSVNRGAQNYEFERKRDLLIQHTTLRLNVPLIALQSWSETDIAARSEMLADVALRLWPGPR